MEKYQYLQIVRYEIYRYCRLNLFLVLRRKKEKKKIVCGA